MPHEKGGRADKFGNRYEARWLVKQYIRLLQGKLSYVTLEPLEEDGADICIGMSDGSAQYYQCKEQSGNRKTWTMSALRGENILSKAYHIVNDNHNVKYIFVSRLPAYEASSLCERAVNNPGDLLVFEKQLTDDLPKCFEQAIADMGQEVDKQSAFLALQRVRFIQYSDSDDEKQSILDSLSYLYPEKDIRSYAGYYAPYFFFTFWNEYPEKMREIILGLFYSQANDVCEMGSSMILAVYMHYNEFKGIVEEECLDDPMRSGFIINKCIGFLESERFHQKTIDLIKDHLCKAVAFDEQSDYLLFKERINPKTDFILLREIAKQKPSRKLFDNLVRYIDEEDVDIPCVIDVLISICEKYPIIVNEATPTEQYRIHEIEQRLPLIVNKLYSISEDSVDLQNMCLGLWDLLYKNGVGSAWKLLQEINE